MSRNKSEESQRFAVVVGSNLKFLRLNRQPFMPQKVPAAAIGVTHQQINKYETGKNMPCAYRLWQLANFYKVTCNDLVNSTYIYENTKHNEVLSRPPGFDASRYEQFADEYPAPLSQLEHDPKMRATYDAILGDE